MKIVVYIVVIVVAVAAVLILIAAFSKPDVFRVKRSIVIKAKPERIAEQIIDFRKWTVWSPYEKKDPAMKRTYSGAGTGEGAVYAWQGSSDNGEGRMEITLVTRSRITIKIDFIKPMEASNTVEFIFEPKGSSTEVTWEMSGKNNLIGKIMQVFIDMDDMVGKDFEAGLAQLKEVAER